MARGTLVTWKDDKGFGFIRPDEGGGNVFVHISALPGKRALAMNSRVEYQVAQGDRGPQARDVRPLAAGPDTPLPARRAPPKPAADLPPAVWPKHFVPVDADLAVLDRPIFHDGANPEQVSLRSGELHLSLTALTPFLPGHWQYPASQLAGARPDGERVLPPPDWRIPFSLAPAKHISEPLRLAGPGSPRLIPGASLAGLLRHELGALLAAPMERVKEQTYSWRPNLDVPHGRGGSYPAAAAVETVAPEGGLGVRVLARLNELVFVTQAAYAALGQPAPGEMVWVAEEDTAPDPRGVRKLKELKRTLAAELQGKTRYLCLGYRHGIDGQGSLNKKKGAYPCVLVPLEEYETAQSVPMSAKHPALLHYRATQLHIADPVAGHLSPRHPQYEAAGFARLGRHVLALDFQPFQVVFLEMGATPEGGERILALGHHFRYRTRYRDSLRYRFVSYLTTAPYLKSALRPELSPRPEECPGEGEAPARLSGARLLRGYVASREEDTHTLGRGDFARLAGRFACNMAIEDSGPGQGGELPPLFLKPLGAPKASAPEVYVRQSPETLAHSPGLATYGDLPHAEPGGELGGRAYYLHHPGAEAADWSLAAAIDRFDTQMLLAGLSAYLESQHRGVNWQGCATSLELAHAWLRADPGLTRYTRARQETKEHPQAFIDLVGHLAGDQAGIALGVAPAGSRFRCTLSYRDLRPWELGALLLALEPQRLGAALERWLDTPAASAVRRAIQPLRDWFNGYPRAEFAHKLGRGRPLGLGSVRLRIEAARRLDEDRLAWADQSDDEAAAAVLACLDRLLAQRDEAAAARLARHLRQWLAVHHVLDRGRVGYPSKGGSIYAYHTDVRRLYAKARRGDGRACADLAGRHLPDLPDGGG